MNYGRIEKKGGKEEKETCDKNRKVRNERIKGEDRKKPKKEKEEGRERKEKDKR